MARHGHCPICGKYTNLTKHHVFKSCVWKNRQETQGRLFYVCRECHDAIEIEIVKRENNILQRYPKLYTDVIIDFLNGRCKVSNYEKRKS